ncbi:MULTISPECIES: EamA/RhaT family transporter [unclassified Psychrobacter]|uniref:EamA/RhaT family transporter n=1 Tax=unclassified Psychrobacter TaxID=196806 RepID=UPI0018F6CC81|nr:MULTISPECIES: EamA/RhaT family transporter [unclassified Psychrobacter]
MLYLSIAVLCSVSVSVLLKLLRQADLDIRQTILAGYPIAFLLTLLLLAPDTASIGSLTGTAWAIIVALGVILPTVFVILGRAIGVAGMVATDAAQRLSLIIPIIAAFVWFGDSLSATRLLGLALGFLALIALVYRPAQPKDSTDAKTQNTPIAKVSTLSFWLFAVWAGYGAVDILFKQVAKQGAAFPLTLFVSFGLAGILLFIYLLIQRPNWQPRALMAGVLLGALNMGNIYAYVRAHQVLADSPSIVFTAMNVGVIALASIIGVGVFKERLSGINLLGIVLAISCVLVLFLL